MNNQRVHERIPAIIKVSYESAGALKVDYARNISQGGLFIATEDEFEVGQRLELHLASLGLRRSIPIPGEVRWVGEEGSPPERGIGIRFNLDDPVLRARIEAMINGVFDPLPPACVGERINILLVDPNRHACRLFHEGIESMARRLFEVEDYFVVVEAYDGLTALSQLRSTRFSLVLMELSTPEVDGVELLRRIRREISQALPIFAMSRPFPGVRFEALAAGADLFMPKPIRLRALFNTLCMMLKLQIGEGKEET